MTPHALALAALAETNPRAHAALVGAGEARGCPLLGYLGWLPPEDLLDTCRAVHLGHQVAETEGWTQEPADVTAAGIRRAGTWRNPRGAHDERRIRSAVIGWGEAQGYHPDLISGALLLVAAGEPIP
ncbi:MAG TPA: hypothetical protein VJ140_05030 [Actinomycetota bacterium]|nr:hypothetical protein [Actinomycetota bacterium]